MAETKQISLSEEEIKTIYASLKSTESTIEFNLKFGHLCGKGNAEKKAANETKLLNVKKILEKLEPLSMQQEDNA